MIPRPENRHPAPPSAANRNANDPFGLPSKKKLVTYGWIGGGILVLGCTLALVQGVAWWRVLLLAVVMITICGGAVAFAIWLSGGQRTETAIPSSGVRPPMRVLKAVPYLLGAVLVLKLIQYFF